MRIPQLIVIAFLAVMGCNPEPEISSTQSFTVFPNPATYYVTVQVPTKGGSAEVEVIDSRGSSFFKKTVTSPGSMQVQVDLQDRPKGIYHVVVRNGSETLTSQFLKK